MKLQLVLLTIIFFIFGCKTRNPTPETSDPIYLDILSEVKTHEQMLATKEKELENAKKDFEHAQPQTGEEKMRRGVMYDITNEVEILKQKVQYWKIRGETRKKYARAEYNRAFDQEKEWPNPQEYQLYMTNKRLVNSSRNWDDRLRESLAKKTATKNVKPKAAAH